MLINTLPHCILSRKKVVFNKEKWCEKDLLSIQFSTKNQNKHMP